MTKINKGRIANIKNPLHPPKTEEEKKLIFELWKSGQGINQIMKNTGFTKITVNKYIREGQEKEAINNLKIKETNEQVEDLKAKVYQTLKAINLASGNGININIKIMQGINKYIDENADKMNPNHWLTVSYTLKNCSEIFRNFCTNLGVNLSEEASRQITEQHQQNKLGIRLVKEDGSVYTLENING